MEIQERKKLPSQKIESKCYIGSVINVLIAEQEEVHYGWRVVLRCWKLRRNRKYKGGNKLGEVENEETIYIVPVFGGG